MCDEWKYDMYSFYEWVNDGQFYKVDGESSVQLDKDILGRVNGLEKLYSPETCIFVPAKINSFFSGSRRKNNLPAGVIQIKDTDKYKINPYAYKIYDVFDTPEEAWNCWKEHKDAQKLALADEYYSAGKIPKRVYDAIVQYDFRVTD